MAEYDDLVPNRNLTANGQTPQHAAYAVEITTVHGLAVIVRFLPSVLA
jgi:hypothetical protein